MKSRSMKALYWLQALPLLSLLLQVACHSSAQSPSVEDQLLNDSTALKQDLEKHAWNLLRDYSSLEEEVGRAEEAEEILREAIAVCPWIPEAYALLGTHLMQHGSQRQIREIFSLFRKAMRIQHALPPPKPGNTATDLLRSLHKRPSMSKHFVGQTFPARLKHDRDQLALLGERGKLPNSIVRRYLNGYDQILQQVPQSRSAHAMNIPEKMWATKIGSVYQRAVYVPEISPLKGPALNPDLDFAALEEQYLSSDPRFISFDGLLTDEALTKLRKYYEEATVFWDSKPGYVGSYLADGGFGNAVVAQLVEELIDAFPRLICRHRLNQAWAYKYDSDISQPIDIHADVAAVNFNFWLSPNEGSLNKDAGGLVVYRVSPPEGTPMSVFNHFPLHENVTKMLAASNFSNFTVPHRTNRAVVFQSDLFHQSGEMHWAPGYSKRRINLTLLFGKMYERCEDSVKEEPICPSETT